MIANWGRTEPLRLPVVTVLYECGAGRCLAPCLEDRPYSSSVTRRGRSASHSCGGKGSGCDVPRARGEARLLRQPQRLGIDLVEHGQGITCGVCCAML